MPRPEKVEAVRKIADKLSRSTLVIATDYRGLSVAEITQLRRKLGEAGIEYRVLKNTLTRQAAHQLGRDSMVGLLEGPTAIAFGYAGISEPARVLLDHIRSSRIELRIKGALLDDRLLSQADLLELANLPSREVLIARVIGGIQSPLATIVNVLNAPLVNLVRALQQIADKQKGG